MSCVAVDLLFAQPRLEVVGELADSRHCTSDTAERGSTTSSDQLEAHNAGQGNQQAPVLELLESRQAPGAPYGPERRRAILRRTRFTALARRLNNTDNSAAADDIVKHREIARLKNLQWQRSARQQNAGVQQETQE